jgi:PPK2 family polyphosphate:nucleotide phosphotransferase
MAHDPDEKTPSRKDIRALVESCRVTSGKGFRLDRHGTGNPVPDLLDKAAGQALLSRGVAELSDMQETLYANSTWSLLLVFQAMDAAGKDSTIKHVMTGVNPQGISVTSFKQPGPEDLAHDFLWRITRALPARGMIGIFNRSHYEEVLVARVHPEILQAQRLPPSLAEGKHFWDHRLEDIAGFERHLGRQGTKVVKFFLNVGRDEQKSRFLDRLDEPDKNWKFSPDDLRERARWDDYMAAYEAAIAATATPEAPWYVVPADHKWLMRLIVGAAVVETLRGLDLKPPKASPELQARFAAARAALAAEA